MRRLWFLLPLYCWGEANFISDFEYGQMLYHNPRGISCAICHGENGEGKDIATYIEDNVTKVIRGTDIREVSLDKMEGVVARNHPIMPKYYLTHNEVKALYDYLRELNHPKAKPKELELEDEYIYSLEENITGE